MTHHRNPSLLLVFLASGLFGGYGKDTAVHKRTLDHYEGISGNLNPEPKPSSPGLCDYDSCRDRQTPCAELAELSGCLCPGLSGPDRPPESPFLQTVAQEGSRVWVHWCAPPSTVLEYIVHAEGHNSTTFGPLSRQALFSYMEPGTRVCVEAVNRAGVSSATPKSCARFEPSGNRHLILKAGLIGGGLGFLLLLSLLGLLLWKQRANRKSRARATPGTEQPL